MKNNRDKHKLVEIFVNTEKHKVFFIKLILEVYFWNHGDWWNKDECYVTFTDIC